MARRAPGFNYTLRERPVHHFPGEPLQHDPHAITKRRIEALKERLALRRALAELWPDREGGEGAFGPLPIP